MLAHDDVWGAIDSLAERNGMSPSGLARRSGLDPTTFNKSKRYAPDGRPRWPSTESISKILRATSSNIGELFGSGAVAGGSGALAVPLLGEAHAGFDLAPTGTEDPVMVPKPPRIVSFPDKRHDPLYALSVVGSSMEPLYRDGDILFIAPSAPTNPGNRVVVKLKDNDVVVKVLKEAAGDNFAFHAVNPDHEDVAVDGDEVEWIARIVYATQ
ncbi:helix-turn-helix transcriptional regulator [Acuticoccus sp. MNP-M23]|uniref:helix-turn-helix transcriptional regulator n=1 Tax=Acuticoccus sp. MNP-M23 TaxID=3072793 RepID=UPI00281593C1|nr:helix-turn-helix transcriptional regulator [Acuticoccus sp. MNP-M23]WMS44159.1 helix-turn-helix transcriptional regulator [Acuticoccus sp. MNP-M23]